MNQSWGDLAWQIPLAVLATLFLVRIVLAPYWMHCEDAQKATERENQLLDQAGQHKTKLASLQEQYASEVAGLRIQHEKATSSPTRSIHLRKIQSFLDRLEPLAANLANNLHVRPEEVNSVTKEVDRYFSDTEYRQLVQSYEDLSDAELAIPGNVDNQRCNLYRKVKKRIIRIKDLRESLL